MPNLEPFVLPVGINHTPVEQKFEARTPQQFEAVRAIGQREEFDFSCNGWNMFAADINPYRGSFMWLWYNKAGKLVASWITPTGKVKETRHGER